MEDIRFMIVNSNLQHSQVLKSELDSRVSFDVYQDTEEKNIWGLMQGGKDDVYVYDRCGRLAYYIPFPISIMRGEDSLVRTAIIATYFRSPCGDTCDQRGISSLEEFLNGNTTDVPESTTDLNMVEFELVPFNTSEEVSKNETVSPKDDEFYKTAKNGSDLYSGEDYDYDLSNETISESNTTHATLHKHNDLRNLFTNNGTFDEIEDSNTTTSTNDSLPTTNPRNITNDNPMLIDVPQIRIESNDTEIQNSKSKTFTQKRKFDRCAEADLSVCKNWSKRKLLRAQTCCSTDQTSSAMPEFCKNYGKKRCKKIRTVLKCCIKTAYVETTTTEATPTVADTTTVADVTALLPYEVICCSADTVGRTCHVSVTGSCENGEFIQEKPDPMDPIPTENTN